jgi:large subunit ribosomal protein L13e
MKHNNAISQNHYVKGWDTRVRTWFNQPAKKLKRRKLRLAKARAVFPRPTKALRPLVKAPTAKYNSKTRFGRGFALVELAKANIDPKFAQTIGIAVDHRRVVKSEETLNINVERLTKYRNAVKLYPLPHKSKKSTKKSKLTTPELPADYEQITTDLLPPTSEKAVVEWRAITPEDTAFNAYAEVRKARSDARLQGRRKARAELKAAKRAEAAATANKKGKK